MAWAIAAHLVSYPTITRVAPRKFRKFAWTRIGFAWALRKFESTEASAGAECANGMCVAEVAGPHSNLERTTIDVSTTPTYWYLVTAALSLLVPAGFLLVAVAGLPGARAWDAALGGLAALGLAGLAYWAIGFAIQFGGVGLVYSHPDLSKLVLEWSPLSAEWGIGWGAAGLSGWFLSGSAMSPLAYALFLAHFPWAVTTAAIPLIALRGRAPAIATMALAIVIGGLVYPLAGNWVQGGGWLGALGNNLSLGHGFIDFGGAGTVHLVAAGVALAALVVWAPRRSPQTATAMKLPTVHLPMLAVLGCLLIPSGTIGWMWANPLQTSLVNPLGLLRGSVNVMLFAAAGSVIPLIYTWFVTGRSDAVMTARGIAAGVVAGLAAGPFVQPAIAIIIGLLAGAAVPFITFVIDTTLRLDDVTGAVSVSGLPAMVGLLLLGLFADGAVGQGWQMTGVEGYLGVVGQGVSGLFTASAFQPDFPGQLQAQIIGILVLALWGFLAGIIVCAPMGLILHGLLGDSNDNSSPMRPAESTPAPAPAEQAPYRTR
jgi:Amt family ammonium transporter